MSTTKHTAEPWYQCDTMAGVVYAGDAECRRAFHSDIVVDAGSTPEEQANAARIVACVNACAGMEDPAATLAIARALMADAACALRITGSHWLADELEASRRALGAQP